MMQNQQEAVIPSKELSFFDEIIGYEKLMVKKYQAFGSEVADPNLKALFERAEMMHHHHQDVLCGCIAAGNKPTPGCTCGCS